MSSEFGAPGPGAIRSASAATQQQLPEEGWFFSSAGINYGPVTSTDLLGRIASGELTPESMVWHQCIGEWRSAREVLPVDGGDGETALEFASFWKRVGGYLIDSVILVVLYVVAGFLIGFFLVQTGIVRTAAAVELVFYAVTIAGTWYYFAGQESSSAKATVGKRAVGIQVVDLNGGRISLGRATVRYVAKIVSGLILMIGFLMAAFSEKSQALHDMLAETYVVER